MKRLLLTLTALAILAPAIAAQTNDFTYQGTLNLSGAPVNGNYDFEFRLFDAENGGAQVSSTATRAGVSVADGRFTVSLAFAGGFPGGDRWLEIWVRPAGGGGFQQLLPRVKIGSSPYAVKSLSADNAANATNAATANNALNLGGVAANQYVQTTDPRLTNARTPTAGSTNYIQNTTTQQATSSFNISGNGTVGGTLSANTIASTTGFNIGAITVLRTPGTNNTILGDRAGNLGGSNNLIAGVAAADSLTSGQLNTILGNETATILTTGSSNTFIGFRSGWRYTTGTHNTFVGHFSGDIANSGSFNSGIGNGVRVDDALEYATAIGASSRATLSNSVFLGRPGGEDTVRIPGNLNLTGAASVNGNLIVSSGNLSIFNGNVGIPTLGSAGATALCRNASNFLATCSSSLRYKTNINPFASGLDLIRRLQPITFDWKEGGLNDLGLGAEDVAAIEPLLVTYNKVGQVEGVKYDRIGVVLVNAVKEQQRQIDAQRDEIQALRSALCELRPGLAVCNPQERK